MVIFLKGCRVLFRFFRSPSGRWKAKKKKGVNKRGEKKMLFYLSQSVGQSHVGMTPVPKKKRKKKREVKTED